MRVPVFVALVYALSALEFALNAQSAAFISPHEGPSSAVDARGVRHYGRDYPKTFSPWQKDIVKAVAPFYSYDDRRLRHQGAGLFKLTIDLKTGAVTNVTASKSTGFFSSLDNSALAALRKWRWQPRKWREVEMPVRFQMSNYWPRRPAADEIPIPNS